MSTVRAFPVARLPRVSQTSLDSARGLGRADWLGPVERAVAARAAGLSLPPVSLRLRRVHPLAVEDLASLLPGRLPVAILADPLQARAGCLALDPELVARVELSPGAAGGSPSGRRASGSDGLLVEQVRAGLRALAGLAPGLDGWRLADLVAGGAQAAEWLLAEPELVGLWLEVRLGETRGFAIWAEGVRSLARGPARAPAARDPSGESDAWPGHLADCPVIAARRLGAAELCVDEFEALAPGDVLLLRQLTARDELVLRLGAQMVRLRREAPGRQRVIGWGLEPREADMDQDGAAELEGGLEDTRLVAGGPRPAAGLDVGGLPVRVVVEAGRLLMPVSVLAGLRLGDVLSLPEPVLGPVELRAGGRLLGRGELVDVEGQRGVRVLELLDGAGRALA